MEPNQESLTLYKSFNTLFLWVTFSPIPLHPLHNIHLGFHSSANGITSLTSFSYAAVFTCMCFYLTLNPRLFAEEQKHFPINPPTDPYPSSFLLRQSHIGLILVRFTYILLQKELKRGTVLEFQNNLWGLGTDRVVYTCTGPPGYIGLRNRFLRIDSCAPQQLRIPSQDRRS